MTTPVASSRASEERAEALRAGASLSLACENALTGTRTASWGTPALNAALGDELLTSTLYEGSVELLPSKKTGTTVGLDS